MRRNQLDRLSFFVCALLYPSAAAVTTCAAEHRKSTARSGSDPVATAVAGAAVLHCSLSTAVLLCCCERVLCSTALRTCWATHQPHFRTQENEGLQSSLTNTQQACSVPWGCRGSSITTERPRILTARTDDTDHQTARPVGNKPCRFGGGCTPASLCNSLPPSGSARTTTCSPGVSASRTSNTPPLDGGVLAYWL